MSNNSDFNLIFAILIGALLSVVGNIFIQFLIFNPPEDILETGIMISCGILFLVFIFLFLVLMWKWRK